MFSRSLSAVLVVLLVLTGCQTLRQLAGRRGAGPAGSADAGEPAPKERVLYYQLAGQVDQGWVLTEQENFQRVEKLVIVSSTILGFKHHLHFDRLEPFETKHLKEEGWHLISFDQGFGVPEVNDAAPAGGAGAGSPSGSAAASAAPAPSLAGAKAPSGARGASQPVGAKPAKGAPKGPSGSGAQGQVSREPADTRVSLLTIKLEWLDFKSQHHKASVQVVKPSENPPSRDSLDRLFGDYVETALGLEKLRKAEALERMRKRAKRKKGKRKKKRSKDGKRNAKKSKDKRRKGKKKRSQDE